MDEALQLAETAYQTLPDDPNVNDTLGWIYYQKNLATKAVTYLEKAAARQPNEPEAQFHLGMAYVQQGQWKKARSSLERAFRLKPDFNGAADARRALADIGEAER